MNVVSPRQGYRFPEDCARRFRAEKLLASGGYGAVLLATQLELERSVVVKILLGSLTDEDQRRRFDNEARIAASLNEPHVVRVLEHGAETVPWIAFELVEGGSLRARLAAGRLAAHEVIQIGEQMCRALEAAHAARILHRDVKPDNILQVTPEFWKLTDFGVARWDQSSRVPTEHGLVLGTPAYLAPEVIRGDAPDERQDLYALGATLFEFATGRPLFQDDNPFRVIEMQLSDAPPRPGEIVADLPRELEAIILRAIAKDRKERFASAAEMGAALQRAGQGLTAPGRRSQARLPRASATAASPPPARTWLRTVPLVVGALVLGAWLGRRERPPVVTPAPTASAPLDAAASLEQAVAAQAPVLEKLDAAAQVRLLDLIGAAPSLSRKLKLAPRLALMLSGRFGQEVEGLSQDFEALLETPRVRDTIVTIAGHELISRCASRREYVRRLDVDKNPALQRMRTRFAERAVARMTHTRALFALDLDLQVQEVAAGQVAWELLLAGILGADASSLMAEVARFEEGRPRSWMGDYIRAHLAAGAGDETVACRYVTHAFQQARETSRLPEASSAPTTISNLIENLRDLAPSRGEPFFDALAEGRRLAAWLPPGTRLRSAAQSLIDAPRPASRAR